MVIHADDDALAAMPEVVVAMHAKSGLTERVRESTVTLEQAEQMVLDYVREHVPEPNTAPLAGNSIATDRGFISRDMPTLDAHLHYRMIDVSSIKELCRRWYPRIYFGAAGQGDDAPGAGRHHRVDPGARLLPRHRVRPAARAEHRPGAGRGGRSGDPVPLLIR